MSTMDERVYCGDEGHLVRPTPGRVYVRLAGGPLDGQLLDITNLPDQERTDGVLLATDRGLFGVGGRALYSPSGTDPDHTFDWDGDTP
ncbi:hypothetical protein OHU17_37110 (plasmid) [Streptomyces goshikiensis]|uniref:Uncharacterized protein n=1 Tax=Streptomyces goshikiensis TaxID=1942 RepID=A0ABZ1RY06_9ACTN|nr:MULTISPECIES: hypothetical protein [Streptomyces]MBP0932352.1 hypothetical protein [Streptomyces sp. KCTC 0041BP]PJN17473.1 hypothetical protein CG724_17870 [Streptomyces sp. CB02120-2]WBY24465.1 hypothetical protein PET44_32820 [Streptomyces goshikiensis]WSS03759.1 hypothetical protein OG224_37520 [Streptomyces goshikiensis]WSY02870.1 hypothetical protein OG590_37280 [Streptomyces goshikiensis]